MSIWNGFLGTLFTENQEECSEIFITDENGEVHVFDTVADLRRYNKQRL